MPKKTKGSKSGKKPGGKTPGHKVGKKPDRAGKSKPGKPGKKPGKKSWKKVDMEDLEESRADVMAINKIKRRQLIGESSKGKAPVAETEDMFTVDTKGSSEGLSRASKREIARAKLFPTKAANIGNSASEELKIARAEAALALPWKSCGAPAKSAPEVFDLWAEPDPKAKAQLEAKRAEDVASTVRHDTGKKAPSKVPRGLRQKPSAVPAVLPAHEGQSMNPEGAAFENLACLAAARELEREAEVEAMDRKIHPMTSELMDAKGVEAVRAMDEAAKVKAYRELVCPNAGDGEEEAEPFSKRSKAQRIKAQSLRNKARKRKDIDEKQAQLRDQKKLTKSVGEVGNILKEMKEREDWLAERRAYKEEQHKKRKQMELEGVVPSTRRLGRTRFKEDAIAVPDSEAASKGLRSMPLPRGSAVKERLTSIVRRGLLPAIPEASRSETIRYKKKIGKLKRSRKHFSPLLRDNLLGR